MGRTSVALGAPDSSSSIMDGFAPEFHFCLEEPNGDPAFGAARVGSTVPTSASSAQTHAQEIEPAQEEVTIQQLWFQLPREQQVRFASCFSQMLLKCFTGTQTEKETEV